MPQVLKRVAGLAGSWASCRGPCRCLCPPSHTGQSPCSTPAPARTCAGWAGRGHTGSTTCSCPGQRSDPQAPGRRTSPSASSSSPASLPLSKENDVSVAGAAGAAGAAGGYLWGGSTPLLLWPTTSEASPPFYPAIILNEPTRLLETRIFPHNYTIFLWISEAP